MTDIVLINPGAAGTIYQWLTDEFTAVEPPTWVRMIAGWLREHGCTVGIIDQNAEALTPQEVVKRVEALSPKLTAIVVVGHQPSASTQQMVGASELARCLDGPTIMVGMHPSALPERTLADEDVDYVCDGEGPLTLAGLLDNEPLDSVPGLVWRERGTIRKNPRATLIPINDLVGDVWDLLPMDRYRAHNWQCLDGTPRSPYASIYTTLGCPFKCLAGDTPINTIYGDIPIRELAERYGGGAVPVYTFDPESRKAFVTDAIAVRKYGENQPLVRVHFDDGAHIDCTPDHKFLLFKWGNGRPPQKPQTQWECEAKDLKPGSHVRALRLEKSQAGYIYVASVEWLADRADVYCLTVPETGWFFANNVLVKNCSFCMINVFQHINRYRMRSPESVIAEIEMLYSEHGVRVFKIADEMFVLNDRHVREICEGLAAKPFANELNIWAYARVDTVKPGQPELMRRAGIRWIALGIESGSAHVRDGADKAFTQDDIFATVKMIQAAGINVIGNFIFGLPDDTHETMRATLDMAKALNCEFVNLYSAMAYPGSRLYDEALPRDLPEDWSGYSQHSHSCRPLPTATLSSTDVLRFRDKAFIEYFSGESYRALVLNKFGTDALSQIDRMVEKPLLRAIT